VFNTSALIGRKGETLAAYRKIHLFDVDFKGNVEVRESAHVAAGREPVVGELDGWPVGLSICYDLRFPELYRRLAWMAPASSPSRRPSPCIPARTTGSAGARRAIENQCFVVAPGQWVVAAPGACRGARA